jgi:tRNA (adenine22-N1)-methyltransferase
MQHTLSRRLTQVAQFIPIGARLADIGTDHAYLPVQLALQGKISSAVASDINEGPLRAASALVEKYQLQSVIDLRQGDGLDVLQPGEVDVVVMAGMGGLLISKLLDKGMDKLVSVNRIIVQPNVSSHLIREWFLHHDWELKAEKILAEKGKVYEVLMAEPGEGEAPYAGLNEEEKAQALYMGPFLLKEKNAAFILKWRQEYELKSQIISSLNQSDSQESKEKREQILRELHWIEGGMK